MYHLQNQTVKFVLLFLLSFIAVPQSKAISISMPIAASTVVSSDGGSKLKNCKVITKAKKFINGKENPKFARISYIVLGLLSLGFISIGVLTDWKGKEWMIAVGILIVSIALASILLSAVGTALPLLLLLASPIYAYLQMKKYY